MRGAGLARLDREDDLLRLALAVTEVEAAIDSAFLVEGAGLESAPVLENGVLLFRAPRGDGARREFVVQGVEPGLPLGSLVLDRLAREVVRGDSPARVPHGQILWRPVEPLE